MAAPPSPLNAGRPWTPEDTERLRHLAREGVAPDLIAERLGRSPRSLSDQAKKIGVGLGTNSATRSRERREARPSGPETRMDEPQVNWATGERQAPRFYVRVRRGARPPMPWTWEIHREGGTGPLRRAVRGYRSAEDAWEAGRAALARLGRAGPR